MGLLSSLFKNAKGAPEKENVKLPEGWPEPKDGIWILDDFERKLKTPGDASCVMKRLKQGDIRTFSLSLPPDSAFCSLLARTLPETAVKVLSLRASSGTTEDVCHVLEALPQTGLSEFKFRCHTPHRLKALETLAAILPRTGITHLSLSNSYYDDAEIAPVLDNLPPGLEALDIGWNKSGSGITSKVSDLSVERVLPFLKNGKVSSLNLDMTDITDAHLPEILKMVRNPAHPLDSVSVIDTCISDGMRMELICAGRVKRRPKVLESLRKSVRPELLEAPLPSLEELRKKGEITSVAKAGRLPELMARQVRLGNPLTAADLTQRSGKEPSPLIVIRRLGDFDKVFAPELWTNVREMQAVWDSCTQASDKVFLDGRNGRPSFAAMKRKAASFAVAAALKARRTR